MRQFVLYSLTICWAIFLLFGCSPSKFLKGKLANQGIYNLDGDSFVKNYLLLSGYMFISIEVDGKQKWLAFDSGAFQVLSEGEKYSSKIINISFTDAEDIKSKAGLVVMDDFYLGSLRYNKIIAIQPKLTPKLKEIADSLGVYGLWGTSSIITPLTINPENQTFTIHKKLDFKGDTNQYFSNLITRTQLIVNGKPIKFIWDSGFKGGICLADSLMPKLGLTIDSLSEKEAVSALKSTKRFKAKESISFLLFDSLYKIKPAIGKRNLIGSEILSKFQFSIAPFQSKLSIHKRVKPLNLWNLNVNLDKIELVNAETKEIFEIVSINDAPVIGKNYFKLLRTHYLNQSLEPLKVIYLKDKVQTIGYVLKK